MRSVRILTVVRGTHGAYMAGQVAELPDAVAAAWLEAGIAAALPEAATLLPPETAMQPAPSRRRAAPSTETL